MSLRRAIVLVGHGGVPADFPREKLARLKALEQARRAAAAEPSTTETALETERRNWPRSRDNDPYVFGLSAIAGAIADAIGDVPVYLAYNEFCAPTLRAAVALAVADGAQSVAVVPSMVTPGGSHAEIEIPAELDAIRSELADVELVYVWPLDVRVMGRALADQVRRAWHRS